MPTNELLTEVKSVAGEALQFALFEGATDNSHKIRLFSNKINNDQNFMENRRVAFDYQCSHDVTDVMDHERLGCRLRHGYGEEPSKG
jgi:hypothetical protein